LFIEGGCKGGPKGQLVAVRFSGRGGGNEGSGKKKRALMTPQGDARGR